MPYRGDNYNPDIYDPTLRQPPPGYTYDPATGKYLGPGGAIWDPTTGSPSPITGSLQTPPDQGTPAPPTFFDKTPPPPSTTPPPPAATPPPMSVAGPAPAAPWQPPGGPPAGFGTPPAPYQSAPSTVPSYTTPPLPVGLQTPYAPPPVPTHLQTPFVPGSFTPATFTPPTAADMLKDPGYQARIALANQGLERAAASRGTINSGGFQQELAKYNQDYASNEFSNLYGRSANTFNTNEQNRFGAFQTNEQNRAGARGINQGEYQSNVYAPSVTARNLNTGEYQGNVLAPSQTQYNNRYAAYLNDEQRKLQDYMTNYTIGHTAQTDYWGRLRDLSGAGLSANLGAKYPY